MAAQDHTELKAKSRFWKGQSGRFQRPRVADEPTIAFQGKPFRSFVDDGQPFLARFMPRGKETA
jgi:hypothetical protein